MKKSLILIFLVYSILCYSQDIEPIQHSFKEYDTTKTIWYNATDSNYVQKRFLTGWHWDSQKALSQALKMNQADIFS